MSTVAAFAAALLLAVGAQGATVFTGDKVQGIPVINQLDVSDLEAGKTHRFMFQGVEMGTGQYWYVPVGSEGRQAAAARV